jgi:adhesin transport system membrane fusion protein
MTDHPLVNSGASPYRRGSVVIWGSLLTLVLLLVWAYFAQVDRVARAQGTVISSSRVQVIQSVDGGVIRELLVHEGDRVKQGQVLARFEDARVKSYLGETEAKRAGILANIARLRAELEERPITYPDQVKKFPDIIRAQESLMAGRINNLRTDIRSLEEALQLARQEMLMTQQLVKNGDASQLELLRAQRQVTDATAKLANRKNQYIQDVNAELSRANEELSQVSEQADQRRQQIINSVIYAPMTGVVKNVKFTTIGAVLRAGDELLSIVPVDESMIIEARVSPKDIGFVHPGLEAMLKFDAFDYTIYGSVVGKVSYVSADSMRDETQHKDADATYYRVHVLTDSPALTQTGKSIEVIPGMTATVDIKLGQRTALDFLIKPIAKTITEGFNAR